MKLVVALARSLQADMHAELRDIERAVAIGTRDAGRGLRTELRRQVASARLGQRLANSWRDKHYPNQQLDAARCGNRAGSSLRCFREKRLSPTLMVERGPKVGPKHRTEG